MLSHDFSPALRILGLAVAVCSGLSTVILGLNPPPAGLSKLNPSILLSSVMIGLLLLAVLGPFALHFMNPDRLLVLRAGIFASAGFANSVALSPPLAVPIQEIIGLVAAVCALMVAVLSLYKYMARDAESAQEFPPNT
ncbi:hypothetical protein [Arthrobacter sp. fls2-241-R2A-172]|uniref:hypothetical protein n=1 Tax=Arthrobacter sp. fls2-241-R2A-172 TaxID=3040325 RepID=UPI00254B892A|nr:hypothetical protein [Arthrobacter sp. fls2-241-R2A-172]